MSARGFTAQPPDASTSRFSLAGQVLREAMVKVYPDKYFQTPIEVKKPNGPLWALNIAYWTETLACTAIFAAFVSYFAIQKTVQTTISSVLIDGQTCISLIPRNILISLSADTSENVQFAQARFGYDECINTLKKADVCNAKNRYDFISLFGVIHPNNSQYYASGQFSFTPTTLTGVTTTYGNTYNPSSAFANPKQNIQSSFSTSSSPIVFFDLNLQAAQTILNYKKANSIMDYAKGIFYDTSGYGTINTGLIVQLPILDLEKALMSKLINFAVHDGVYYGIATEALFPHPMSVAVDSNGNFYVADTNFKSIRVIRSKIGFTETIGANASPPFNGPRGVALDSLGNVYVADTGNSLVRKIDLLGQVTTIGINANPPFTSPQSIAVDNSFNVYVADGCLVRKIDNSTGIVTYIGTSASPPFGCSIGLAVDQFGFVYVADRSLIRKIDPSSGAVTSIGTGASPPFISPTAVAVDQTGNLLVTDVGTNLVRNISGSNVATIFDGSYSFPPFGDMLGIAIDSQGSVYISDTLNQQVRQLVVSASSFFSQENVKRLGIYSSPAIIKWNISLPITSHIQWPANYQHYADSFGYLVNWKSRTNTNISSIDRDTECRGVLTANSQCLIFRKAEYNIKEDKIHVIFLALNAPSIAPYENINFVVTLDLKASDNWQMNTAYASLYDLPFKSGWEGEILTTPNGTNWYTNFQPVVCLYTNYSETQQTNWLWDNSSDLYNPPPDSGFWTINPTIPNYKNLLSSGDGSSLSKIPISDDPERYMLMYLTLTSGDKQMVTYDTFTDNYFTNDAAAATTTYMLAYTYGVCNGNLTRSLIETGLNNDYSKECRGGNGIYYQSPNVYYGIPLNCLSITYDKLHTDCPEIKSRLESLVDTTCEASFHKVCEQVYQLNPPFSCTLDVYLDTLTIISLSLSNTLAAYGLFSLLIGLFLRRVYVRYQPKPEEETLIEASAQRALDNLAFDLGSILICGKPRIQLASDKKALAGFRSVDGDTMKPVHDIEMVAADNFFSYTEQDEKKTEYDLPPKKTDLQQIFDAKLAAMEEKLKQKTYELNQKIAEQNQRECSDLQQILDAKLGAIEEKLKQKTYELNQKITGQNQRECSDFWKNSFY